MFGTSDYLTQTQTVTT